MSVETTAPAASSVTPQDGAKEVAVSSSVKATFSEAMSPSTPASRTLILTEEGSTTSVAATTTYDPAIEKVVLAPAEDLEAGTTYMATIKGGTDRAKDAAGNSLEADKVWSFTTVVS